MTWIFTLSSFSLFNAGEYKALTFNPADNTYRDIPTDGIHVVVTVRLLADSISSFLDSDKSPDRTWCSVL